MENITLQHLGLLYLALGHITSVCALLDDKVMQERLKQAQTLAAAVAEEIRGRMPQ